MAEPIVDLDPLLEQLRAWPGLVASADLDLVSDCLVLLDHLEDARSVADVGSGGGLPGLPLKLARPDLRVTLIEANRRKAAFLVQTAARLGLSGVEVRAQRAEEAGHDPSLREQFDAAVVRAVARLSVLAELCLPLVRVGGRLLAMKTEESQEPAQAGSALAALGGELVAVVPAPSAARERGVVVVIAKVAPTPARFPRRAGMPERRPL